MSLSAGVFLILSWAFIMGLTVFCFAKVFSKKDMD